MAFSMKLRPRAIGRLDITISAITDEKQSDAVRKALFVKVKSVKFCFSTTITPAYKIHLHNHNIAVVINATVTLLYDIILYYASSFFIDLPQPGCEKFEVTQNIFAEGTDYLVQYYTMSCSY